MRVKAADAIRTHLAGDPGDTALWELRNAGALASSMSLCGDRRTDQGEHQQAPQGCDRHCGWSDRRSQAQKRESKQRQC